MNASGGCRNNPSSMSRLSLDDVPFSVLVKGLQAVRRARSRRGNKKREDGVESVNEAFKRAMRAGFGSSTTDGINTDDFEARGDSGGTKYGALDVLWKEVCGYVRRAEAKREDAKEAKNDMSAERTTKSLDSPVSTRLGKREEPYTRKASDEEVENQDVFMKATALPIEDTVVLLSLVSPSLDEDHPLFSMKEKKLADHYIECLDLLKNGQDAQWLLNYMNKAYRPDTTGFSRRKKAAYARAEDGNFFSVLRAVLCERAAQPSNPEFTIGRAWRLFGTLCANRESARSGYSSFAYGALKKKPFEMSPEGAGDADGVQDLADPAVDMAKARERKKEERIHVFRTLLKEATADENAEFARLIVLRGGGGAMRDELKYETLLNWFHPAAKDHYSSAHNIRKLVRDCRDPKFTLGRVDVSPGSCANVMLTARPLRKNLEEIANTLATGRDAASESSYFFIEPKLDGERMQLHKIGKEIITFTRNRKESTALYADLLRDAVCQAVRAENVVLDGELMVWDGTLQKYVSFEAIRAVVTDMLSDRIGEGEMYTIKFMVFDIMYVDVSGDNGCEENMNEVGYRPETLQKRHQTVVESTEDEDIVEGLPPSPLHQTQPQIVPAEGPSVKVRSVIHLPLQTRRRILQKNVKSYATPFSKRHSAAVEVIPSERGRTEADLLDRLNLYVSDAYEGLIAKCPTKSYLLGERDPAAAIKLKPDYFEGGLQDVDVIILGARYGTSKGSRRGRMGTLSSFLIGVRSDNSAEAGLRQKRGEVGRWTPIGGVGTGYSYEQLEVLQRRLAEHWRDLDRSRGRQGFPDFWDHKLAADNMFTGTVKWIDPRDSVVLQVRAYELARRHGYALRFPRCDRIRDEDEKPFWDVISLEELVELDNAKSPAAIGAGDGNDQDAVGPSAEKPVTKRAKTEVASAIERLKMENFLVREAGGGKRKVAGHQTAADISDIKDDDRSDVLAGMVFVVYASHGQGEAKHDLERRIYRMGGRFSQVSEGATYEMAVDAAVARVRSSKVDPAKRIAALRQANGVQSAGKLSIVRPEWLTECEAAGFPVPVRRRHVFYANKSLELELVRHTDAYGDSWLNDATGSSLESCFVEMDALAIRGELSISSSTKNPVGGCRDSEIQLAVERGMRDSGSIFWGLHVCYLHVPTVGAPLEASVLLLSFFGATVAEGMLSSSDFQGTSVSHVLVNGSASRQQVNEARTGCGLNLPRVAVVSDDWVLACVIEQKLVEPFINRMS